MVTSVAPERRLCRLLGQRHEVAVADRVHAGVADRVGISVQDRRRPLPRAEIEMSLPRAMIL